MIDEEINMQPIDHTDTHNLYMTSDDALVVEERDTGMKYHVKNRKEAYAVMGEAWENVRSSEGRARELGHKTKSLSIEQKLDKQKSVVRRMVHCISKRLAQANQTILEEVREDMDHLMNLHEQLASGQSLDEAQKSWLRQRFEYYKEMEL